MDNTDGIQGLHSNTDGMNNVYLALVEKKNRKSAAKRQVRSPFRKEGSNEW